MRTCYVLPQGKVPKVADALYVRMTSVTFNEVYDQYLDYQKPLCVLLAAEIPTASLLKFVESVSDITVVVNHTPDLVFLSRFNSVVMGIKPVITPFPPKTSAQALLEECKKVVH
jgi:hypothetical protein